MGVDNLARRYRFSVRWRAFPLHPETPTEGRSLEDLFQGRGITVDQVMARLKRAAHDLGLPLGDRTTTYNSRLAQEVGKWAEDRGRGEEFHMAAFRAYFVDGLNLALTEVLTDLAESVGLDGREAGRVIDQRSYRGAVDADWEKAAALQVKAVPTLMAGGQRLVGMPPEPQLEAMLIQAGAEKTAD